MALPAKITKAAYAALDPILQAEYSSTDNDMFLLDVNSVDGLALEDVSGLKSALSKEKSNVKNAEQRLQLFGDLDAVEAKSALAKVSEMANWTPEEKVKEQIEAREKQLVDKYNADQKKLTEDRDDLQKQLEGQLIEGAALMALTEHKGNPTFLLSHIKDNTSIERGSDGKFVAQVLDQAGHTRLSNETGNNSPMTIDEFVSSMKSEDRFKAAFEGSGAAGIGGSGGSGGAGSSGDHTISSQDAQDFGKYEAAKVAAAKAGVQLIMTE